jgi:hypothetical protein
MRLWYSATRRGASARGCSVDPWCLTDRSFAPFYVERLNRRRRAYTFRRVFLSHLWAFAPGLDRRASHMTARLGLFWIATAVCVVAELAILRSLLFGRARAAERSATGPLSDAIRARRPSEIAWAIIPAVGLLFVLYLTWRAVDVPAAGAAAPTPSGATIGV